MKLSDDRLADLEARWKPVGNVVVSGAEAVALLAEVREARRRISIVVTPSRCLACGLPDHQCPTGGRLLR